MNYKQQLNDLSTLLNKLKFDTDTQLNDIISKLLAAVAQVPEYKVNDTTLVMSKLKYEPIKFDDTETWKNIAARPELVLHRWARRLWLLNQTEFYYGKREEIEKQYGVGGRKSFDNFLFYTTYYVNALFANPSTANKYLNDLIGAYRKGTVASKKKFEDFFAILEEELIKYENDN